MDTQEQAQEGVDTVNQTPPEQVTQEQTVNREEQEKTLLLQRARLMGLNPSNNAKVETLRSMIAEKMAQDDAGSTEAHDPEEDDEPETGDAGEKSSDPEAPVATQPERLKTPSIRKHMHDEQMRLIRVRIANLDPKKADLQGEIVTVANKFLGTVKVFVPFGEQTEDGWHIPYVIYKQLEKRKFLQIKSTKKRVNGVTTQEVTQKWVKEFSLEVLPPLTPQELGRLAQAQLAAGSVGN